MSEDVSQCWIETAKEAKRIQRLALNASESSRRCLAHFLGNINSPQSPIPTPIGQPPSPIDNRHKGRKTSTGKTYPTKYENPY